MPTGRFAIRSAAVAIATTLVIGGALRHGLAATDEPDGASLYIAKCVNCHQSDGRGGGPYPPLAGNPNVTTADTRQLIATVVGGRYGRVMIQGRMYYAPMPAQGGALTNAQIAAVLTYIRSTWGNTASAISESEIVAAQPIAMRGAQIYATTCGDCHPADGSGTSSAPPLDGNPHVTAADPAAMIGIIVNGMSGPLVVNAISYNAPMPSWQSRLSNADVAAVATYIRSAWSNRAAAVTEQAVARTGPAVSAAIGRWIYAQTCASCHGIHGAASGNRKVSGNPDILAGDTRAIIRIVKFGKSGMPAWRGQLSEADIASVLTFMRSAWGNTASAITEADVSRIQ